MCFITHLHEIQIKVDTQVKTVLMVADNFGPCAFICGKPIVNIIVAYNFIHAIYFLPLQTRKICVKNVDWLTTMYN